VPNARPRPYHHGDLPEALKRAVLELVVEGGLESVTVAGAARRVGVGPTAPYKHFESLDDLLVATALDGYQRFRERQKQVSEGQPDAESELLAVLDDYFAFARDEPGAFTLIFNSSLTRRSRRIDPWAQEDYDNALRLVSQMTGAPAEECRELALAISALTIGQARMTIERYSPVSTIDEAPALTRAGIRMLVDGFHATRRPRNR
jgi:AcrR family transcriptional regulator